MIDCHVVFSEREAGIQLAVQRQINASMNTYFIVEDNPFYSHLLKEHLLQQQVAVHEFDTGDACLQHMYLEPNVVFLDYYLEGTLTGIETLQRIKALHLPTQVVFLTSQQNLQIALDSLRNGAFDYIEKNEETFDKIQDALARIQLLNELEHGRASLFTFFKNRFKLGGIHKPLVV